MGYNWRGTLTDFARTSGVLAGFCVTFIALILGGKIGNTPIETNSVTFGQLAVLLFGFSTSLFICASEFFMHADEFDVFSIPEPYREILKRDRELKNEDWTAFEREQTEKCRQNERIGRAFYNIAIFTIFLGLLFAIAPYNSAIAVLVSSVGIVLELWQIIGHLFDRPQSHESEKDQKKPDDKSTEEKSKNVNAHKFKHFFLAFFLVGLIVLASGIVFYVLYSDAPTDTSNPNLQGFAVLKNDTITPETFGVTIYADPPQLYFRYFFQMESAGNYDVFFIFIFPFYIQESITSDYSLTINHTSTGSLILVHYRMDSTGENLSDYIDGLFSINQTFMSGNRGSHVLSLPFGMGLNYNTLLPLYQEYGSYSYQQNVTISVVLPKNDVVTSYFPTPSPSPHYGAYYGNITSSSLEWDSSVPINDMVSLNDETVILQNQDEISRYSFYLFFSGILLGTGISLVFTVVYDDLKERHERTEDFD